MEKKNKLEKEEKKIKKKVIKEVEKEKKKSTKPKITKKPVIKKEKITQPISEPSFSTEPFLEDKEKIKEEKQKKYLSKMELIVIFVFSVIMLILLCNRTFFRNNYKTSKININLPLLMFFKEDTGNKLVLRTLRKTQYIEGYFNDYLKENTTKYNCNGYSFYYDDKNRYAIYDINIRKDFIVKTVTIYYASGDANCLCNADALGKKAEEICNN